MRSASFIVTIDGPAASGKTSVSRLLALKRGWAWISTGAFYRGLAFVASRENVSVNDEDALANLCLSSIWRVEMGDDRTKVFLRSEDVTDEIYAEDIGLAASLVSRYPKVRANLLGAQRACADSLDALVAEGRDCGTIVFPDANVKFYLTAGTLDRAARRARQQGGNVEEMRQAQVQRDYQDSSRQTAPMQIPTQAHIIDTTALTLDQVVEQVDAVIGKELAQQSLSHL